MDWTRRGFLGVLAAAAGTAAIGAWPRTARARSARGAVPVTYFQSIPIERGELDPKGTVGGTRSRLNVILGEGGNSLLVADKGGWVLVDTKAAPFGVLLRNHLKYFKADPVPPGLVINTHHHADTTGGNHAFLGTVPVIAHPKAIKRVQNQHMLYSISAQEFFNKVDKLDAASRRFIDADVLPLKSIAPKWEPKDFLPDRAMDGDMEVILVGEGKDKCEVELYHFGPGHTECDIIARFPKYNVIAVGDLCFNRSHAIIDRGSNGNSRSWTNVLNKIIDLCDKDTIIVPGRGELTDVQGLKDQIRYFDIVRENVLAHWKNRGQRNQAETMVIEEFKDYALPQNAANAYGSIYDEIVAENRAVKDAIPVPPNAGGRS